MHRLQHKQYVADKHAFNSTISRYAITFEMSCLDSTTDELTDVERLLPAVVVVYQEAINDQHTNLKQQLSTQETHSRMCSICLSAYLCLFDFFFANFVEMNEKIC